MASWMKSGTSVNPFHESRLLIMKVTSSYVFGLELTKSFLKDRATMEKETYFLTHASDQRPLSMWIAEVTIAWNKIVQNCLPSLCITENKNRHRSESFCLQLCRDCTNNGPKTTEESVCAHMHRKLASSEQPIHLRERILAGEMYDHLLPATATMGLSLGYIITELSKHFDVQEQVAGEARSIAHVCEHDESQSRLQMLEQSPMLNAVILETLRLHAPAKGPFPRVVPDGGSQIGSYEAIPAGTIVSTSADYLHLDADVYEDPNEWRPQRWIDQNSSHLDEMHRSFWAFSSGPRMCIAKHFAMRGKNGS